MLTRLNKAICLGLVISTSCLPLAALHAQEVGKMTNHAVMLYNNHGDIIADSQSLSYHYNPLNQLTMDTTQKHSIVYQNYATGMQASEAVTSATTIDAASHILYHYYAGQGKLLDSVQKNNFSGYLLAKGRVLRFYKKDKHIFNAQIYLHNHHQSIISVIASTRVKAHQYNAYGTTIFNAQASSQAKLRIADNPLL